MGFAPRLSKFYFLCLASLLVFSLSIYKSYRYGILKKQSFHRGKRSAGHQILKYSGPQSALDPKSAFYGMIYKDTYGQPLTAWGKQSFKREKEGLKVLFPELAAPSALGSYNRQKEKWKKLFPILTKAMRRYRIRNRRKNKLMFTNSVVISRNVPTFPRKVGDELIVMVHSVDSRNHKKTFGGDYLRARLIKTNKTSNPDGIPCRIFDKGDGSYTIRCPLLSEGTFRLDINLVMTVEGIYESMSLVKKTSMRDHSYLAIFENGESRRCNMNLNKDKSTRNFAQCDYSNPRNREPWFCARSLFGPCRPIVNILYTGPGPADFINLTRLCSLTRCHRSIKTGIEVKVDRNASNNNTTKPNIQNGLPMCKEMFTTRTYKESSFGVSGYFENRHWVSLRCKNILTNIRRIKKCLRNKIVYFFGDSTIRYFFYLIVDKLWLHVEGPNNNQTWQQPKIAYDNVLQRNNITLYFRAHGPPLQNSGPPSTRPYISDSIRSIPIGGEDVYVIFTIGAHLLNYEPSVYIHRLKGIREAIAMHHRKYPETRILVKGLSVVEYRFEWYLLRYNTILKDAFKHMKNVVFLDLWELTSVWPQQNFHPLPIDINEQALFMLSYLCD